eukprot:4805001-Pleurochrysis_carterae.AAC.1
MHVAHVSAGGGVGDASLPDLGFGELARRACVAGGSMPITRGIRLFEELFGRIQRAAVRRRTRADAPRLDLGAMVRTIITEDLAVAKQSDMMMRAAVEAARADAVARGAHQGRGRQGDKPGGTPTPAPSWTTPLTGLRQPQGKGARQAQLSPLPALQLGVPPPPPPLEGQQGRPGQRAGEDAAPGDGRSKGARGKGTGSGDGKGGGRGGGAQQQAKAATSPRFPPGSILSRVGRKGREPGAVEALDILAREADPEAVRTDFPCPWLTLFGACRKGPEGCRHCGREAQGGKERPWPAGVLEQ